MSSHKKQSIIYLCLVFVVYFNKYADSQTCDPLIGSTKKCACAYTDGDTTKQIDFTLLGNKDGTAAFAYKPTGDYKYAYNPCFPFKDSFCQGDTAACQVSTNEEYMYPIGDPNVVSYSVADSNIVLTYGANGGRVAVVTFQCDEKALTTKSTTYQPFGEASAGKPFTFTVGTCLACLTDVPNCHTGGTGSSTLTGGGILCIIFTVLLVVYVVGGILFQKFGRGATGKELVPNYAFWSDFPILVKDGFMFLIGLCRGGSSGSDYESIK